MLEIVVRLIYLKDESVNLILTPLNILTSAYDTRRFDPAKEAQLTQNCFVVLCFMLLRRFEMVSARFPLNENLVKYIDC